MTVGRAVLAVLVAVGLTVGIVAATTSAQSANGRTLTFKEVTKAAKDGQDDVAPKTLSKGNASPADRFTTYIPLNDTSGHPAGAVNVSCTITRGGHFPAVSGFCTGVAKFTDGTISFSGLANFQTSTSTFAVTGGTGAYVGARGTVTSAGDKNATDTVKLLP